MTDKKTVIFLYSFILNIIDLGTFVEYWSFKPD